MNPFSNPKAQKKYHSVKNVEKINAIAPSKPAEPRHQDDTNINRPSLFKKKDKAEEKQDERVWKNNPEPAPQATSTPPSVPCDVPSSALAQ